MRIAHLTLVPRPATQLPWTLYKSVFCMHVLVVPICGSSQLGTSIDLYASLD